MTGRAVDRSAVTREDVAASLLAYGCVECGRELRADPVDSVYRQCECHSGSKNSTGYVWRGITLGLTDDRAARRDGFDDDDDEGWDEKPWDDSRSRSGKRRKRLAERVATLERRVRGVESTVTERRAKETNAGAKETTTNSVTTPVRTTTTTTPESTR